MRVAILAIGIAVSLGPTALALPLVPPPVVSTTIQVHGCHHYYAQGLSGWHRHDKDCRTLRGIVGRKSRSPEKS
jgi:hypothetical protein